MLLTVAVVCRGERPADGTPVVIELRDSSLMDVAAVRVDGVQARVGEPAAGVGETVPFAPDPLAVAQLEAPDDLVEAHALTVFAHVLAAGTPEVAAGDFLTVQSYPVTPATPDLVVEVVRIG